MDANSRNELADAIVEIGTSIDHGAIFDAIKTSGSWKVATNSIKQQIGQLGSERGFEVHTSGLESADGGEWLYDLVWIRSRDGLMREMPLVMESELMQGTRVADAAKVDDDFLKLIQCRTDVRVWRAFKHNPEIARQHIENCKEQIRGFDGTQRGDTYVFIISVWSDSSVVVEKYGVS